MEIKVGEVYITRNGRKAEVVYEFKNHEACFKFIAVVTDVCGSQREITVTEEGNILFDCDADGDDLVSPAPKKIKVEGWSNVYPEGGVSLYKNKEAADTWATENRIACKRIEFEVEEGEGL